MFYLAGIIINFFLVVLLLSKKGKTLADFVLAVWLCVIGVHLSLYYGHFSGIIFNYPYLLGIQIPMPLLQGPFLSLSTLTVTRSDRFRVKYLLHFVPPLIMYLIFSKFFLLSGEEKIVVYQNKGAGFEVYTTINLIALIVSGFAYVILSFYELRKYKASISEEFSNTERINLNWLRYLIYGILVIWLIVLFIGHDPLIFAAVVVFIILLGYFGIRHMGIFTYRQEIVQKAVIGKDGDSLLLNSSAGSDSNAREQLSQHSATGQPERTLMEQEVQEEVSPLAGRIKYEKSGLQKETAEKIRSDLHRIMQEKKLYKNEELSLAELARQLGVHPNNLSQVINSYENKSFYDYINNLRIEEFKTLLLLPENRNYTLLALAFECGFNSKTSFNRNFKKFTGLSPSAYLKEINVQLEVE
jgi:AraC-like DNA-binding protein